MDDTASALLADAHEVIAGLERELRAKRSRITRLERDKADRLSDSRHHRSALEVLRHWKAVCMPTAREIDSPPRLEAVIARLEAGWTVDELMRCADGYAKRPFVVDGKRRARGRVTERHVDADLIYRDEKHVRTGLVLAEAPDDNAPPDGWERIDWRAVRRANHRVILQSVSALFEADGQHYARCPRCATTLTIFSPQYTSESMLRCAGCGLDEREFFAALQDDVTVTA